MKVSSLEQVVRALNSGSVPFILVGGLAVNAHGYGRATAAMDIVVRLTPEHIRAAFAALASLGYAPRVPVSAEGFADPAQRIRWVEEKGMQVLNFHSDRHRETPVDIFVTEPFDFEQEYGRALVEEVADDLTVRIVSLESLIRMKATAGRPQDLADIAELRSIHRIGARMPEHIDWSLTTFEGNRLRQHQEFMRLSFREKLFAIQRLGEVAQMFRSGSGREAVASTTSTPSGGPGRHRRDAGRR